MVSSVVRTIEKEEKGTFIQGSIRHSVTVLSCTQDVDRRVTVGSRQTRHEGTSFDYSRDGCLISAMNNVYIGNRRLFYERAYLHRVLTPDFQEISLISFLDRI